MRKKIYYKKLSRKGIEPLSQKLQAYALPLSYLDFIKKIIIN